jgi:hypothetical protein
VLGPWALTLEGGEAGEPERRAGGVENWAGLPKQGRPIWTLPRDFCGPPCWLLGPCGGGPLVWTGGGSGPPRHAANQLVRVVASLAETASSREGGGGQNTVGHLAPTNTSLDMACIHYFMECSGCFSKRTAQETGR